MTATVEELYEQAKKSLRQACGELGIKDEPGTVNSLFILACSECGLPFRNDIVVGMVAEHANLEHGIDVEGGEMQLDLIWIGEGPPPEAGA